MTPKTCPECKVNFEGDDIYEHFLDKYKDEAKALETAGHYGWTKETPYRFSKCIAVYSMEKDRTTHWQCPDCKHKWVRK